MSIVETDTLTAAYYGQSDIAFVVHIFQTPDHPGAGAWYYTLECEHKDDLKDDLHIESKVVEQDQGPYPSALAAAAAGKTAAIRKCAAHNVEAAPDIPEGYATIAVLTDEGQMADPLEGTGTNRLYLAITPDEDQLAQLRHQVEACQPVDPALLHDFLTPCAGKAARFEAMNPETVQIMADLADASLDVALLRRPEQNAERALLKMEGRPMGLDALDEPENDGPDVGGLLREIAAAGEESAGRDAQNKRSARGRRDRGPGM